MSSEKLDHVIQRLESHLDHYAIENTKVSKSNVAWHLDHSLKVINSVVKTLQASEPDLYTSNFSFLGRLFFTLGFFPRGKARAPKYVKPPETVLKEDIVIQLELAKTNVKTITSLHQNAFFKHPIFGNINTKRVYKFLVLHTTHHLKIIDDILNK